MMRATDPLSLAFSGWALAMEATTVIGLRMARMATGDAAALAESQLMVSEKIESMLALQMKAMTGGLGTEPGTAARRTISHYRKAVAKNRRRLS